MISIQGRVTGLFFIELQYYLRSYMIYELHNKHMMQYYIVNDRRQLHSKQQYYIVCVYLLGKHIHTFVDCLIQKNYTLINRQARSLNSKHQIWKSSEVENSRTQKYLEIISCKRYFLLLLKQIHPNFDITNDRVRLLLFTISRNSLYRDFLIVKGAGICSLYHEIYYIENCYIKLWVQQLYQQ